MEKAIGPRPVLVKIFYGGALALFAWFFISGMSTLAAKSFWVFPLALGFLGLLLAAAYFTEKYSEKITDRILFRICFGAAVVLAVSQLAAGYLLAVNPGWDFGGVYLSACDYVTHGRIITHEHYFERFSNNTGLLMWEIILFRFLKLLGIESSVLYGAAGIAMNIFAIDLSILFTVLFARRTWGNARAVLTLFLCVLFTPFVLYSPIFYTDSMSLPFTAIPLYLFSCGVQAEKPAVRLPLWVATGLLLAFGTKVKGNIAILLVAFCLYAAFNFGWKRFVAFLLAAWLPFFGFSALFDSQVKRMGLIHEKNLEQIQFPTEYWFYMGLKSPGGFNQEDFDFMYKLESRTERKHAGRAGIVRRIAEMGVAGMLRHLTEKSAYVFGDGTYFIRPQLNRQPLRKTALRDFVNSPPYFAISGGYHLCLLLLLLFGLAAGLTRRHGFDWLTLLYTALFGLALFLMMWEARSRYLLNFSPLMLLLAGDALVRLYALGKRLIRERPGVPLRGETWLKETTS